MSKQLINATELVNTEVNFVSLVKRGANRIPFRITKEDQNMIDLHKIGRAIFKMAEPKVAVVGAIVQKGADLDKVNAVLKAAGLDVEALEKSEKDGVVTLAKSEAPSAASVVKVSNEVALVVSTDLQKGFSGVDFSSWSFGEVMATEGYFTGICMAVDVLKSTVANILHEASSSSEAAAAVGKAADELKGYLIQLTGGLPVDAFKAEVEFSKAGSLAKADEAPAAVVAAETVKADEPGVKDEAAPVEAVKAEEAAAPADEVQKAAGKKPSDPDNDGDNDTSANGDTDMDAGKKGKKKKGSSDAEDAKDGGDDETEENQKKKQKEDAAAEPVEKAAASDKDQELDDSKSGAGASERGPEAPAVKADNAEILEAIGALRKSVEDEIAGIVKSVSEISDRVDQVSTLAKKTDADLNGTVFNDAGGDVVRTAKSDTSLPLLDTAYSRRTA